MKIAVDASQLIEQGMVGTQNYLFELISALSAADSVNRYVIYFRKNPSATFFEALTKKNPNFSFKYVQNSVSWTQLGFAKECLLSKPDIIFCPWHTMPIIHRPNSKVVSVMHGLEYAPWQFGPSLYTCVFSDHVISVSNDTKKDILERYKIISPDKITVVHEGLSREKFHRADQISIDKVKNKYGVKNKYVFFVGTFGPRKNIERMLEAFSHSIEEPAFKNLSFVLGGNVPNEYKKAHKACEDFNLTSKVQFIGKVPDEDLTALLSGAELFSFVSLTEGFGLPILEAMACETPVLTSNRGALPEVAGDAAYLVDPYDIEAISSGMKAILSSPSLRDDLVKKGRQRAGEFNWSTTATKVLAVLEDVYARKK